MYQRNNSKVKDEKFNDVSRNINNKIVYISYVDY